jgi:hypothetical protein
MKIINTKELCEAEKKSREVSLRLVKEVLIRSKCVVLSLFC